MYFISKIVSLIQKLHDFWHPSTVIVRATVGECLFLYIVKLVLEMYRIKIKLSKLTLAEDDAEAKC